MTRSGCCLTVKKGKRADEDSNKSRVVRPGRTFPTTTMKSTFQHLDGRRLTRASAALGLLIGLLTASGLSAQTAEEHASHHPAPAGGAMPAAPGAAPAMAGMPAAGGTPAPGGMGEMMKGMGAPPKKELYPELMSLPELTPEKRQQVEQQAGERMHTGTMLMGQALDALNAATPSNDYVAMHEAMRLLREGAAQLDSGIAARRALAEGRAPRAVALAWFKQEMNLSLGAAPAVHRGFGGTPLHLFAMALLVVFAVAMLAMYFFKMRRAAALFGRIEPDKGSPPPGSAPELAGGKPSSVAKPPSKEKPPSGGKPPTGDKPPSTDKQAAPDDDPLAPTDKSAASAEKPVADAPPKAP